MDETNVPLYLDWSFWAVIVAAIAVVLSQIPPIHILLKKAKIDFELYSKIAITHKVGNPNLEVHLLISNTGGRKIRVKKISASISRDNKHIITLPAQNYRQTPNDKNTILLTSFSLSPNEDWSHSINLLNYFNREQEKEYLRIESNMRADYREKQKENPSEELVEHLPEHTKSAIEFFEKHFIWLPGEYKLSINIQTDHKAANISKDFNFIIFETQSEQLKDVVKRYKYGEDIWWNPDRASGIIVDITEA